MGYTHYWRRSPTLNQEQFGKASDDIQAILRAAKKIAIKLSGTDGEGKPHISIEQVMFNGESECGHPEKDLGYAPWPAKDARGISQGKPPEVTGPHFAGAQIAERGCGGDCSGMDFLMDRKFVKREWDHLSHGRYFQFCITDFKPYDLPVTASLIRLKERFPKDIYVSSDGNQTQWEDGEKLCRELFGAGAKFVLEAKDSENI